MKTNNNNRNEFWSLEMTILGQWNPFYSACHVENTTTALPSEREKKKFPNVETVNNNNNNNKKTDSETPEL